MHIITCLDPNYKLNPKNQTIIDKIKDVCKCIKDEYDVAPNHGDFYYLRNVLKNECGSVFDYDCRVLTTTYSKLEKSNRDQYIEELLETNKDLDRKQAEEFLDQFEWE